MVFYEPRNVFQVSVVPIIVEDIAEKETKSFLEKGVDLVMARRKKHVPDLWDFPKSTMYFAENGFRWIIKVASKLLGCLFLAEVGFYEALVL